ncbi:MAG: class I SAM-dependent methyltransferase [Calothrix sp. MO_167.B12]|nr:class I SAM-dependent methyltransferase [Calothrix sp. MO_167.B12]
MSQYLTGNGFLPTTDEVRQLVRELHHGNDVLNDEEIDTAIGLEITTVEENLIFIDLVLCYGQHRLYQGDIPYNLIRELYTRLGVFIRLSNFRITHILDIGSGYGRPVLYGALLWPDIHFCGIEMVLERVLEAQKVSKIRGLNSVEFISGDATQIPWPFADCFFLMNSFSLSVLPKVLSRLESLSKSQDFIVVSIFSSNDYLSQCCWLKEIVLSDFLNEKLTIKIFQTLSSTSETS